MASGSDVGELSGVFVGSDIGDTVEVSVGVGEGAMTVAVAVGPSVGVGTIVTMGVKVKKPFPKSPLS